MNAVMDLNVHRFGSGRATVLLLHGLSSAGPVWRRVAAALEASGYSSLAPDFRGHGGSRHPGDYALDAYASDVIESCPGPWNLVVGHSLGGAVAVRVSTLAPQFSNAYLLLDPAIDLDAAAAHTLREALTAETERPSSIAELMAEHPRWSSEDAEHRRESVLATSPAVMAGSFNDNPDWEVGRELSEIPGPTHILGAEDEPLYTAAAFDRHYAGREDLTFEVVPNTGHSIHRDDPATVVDRALRMLRH